MPIKHNHLPATPDEVRKRGWDVLDIILVTGDAHVDHPTFPAALLGRVLESAGFRVGVISRPEFQTPKDMERLGLPRLFFGVTAGSLDSMVGNYTALKKWRSDDPYAPGGKAGGRPDRALTVYCNLIRRAFGKSAFIVAGGLEASLRRFAHYDYWSDSVRRSILMDCGADVLVSGMGEGPIVEMARRLSRLLEDNPDLAEARQSGRRVNAAAQVRAVHDVRGVVYRESKNLPEPTKGVALPTTEEVAENRESHAKAHQIAQQKGDGILWQDCSGMRIIANPAWPPLTTQELDQVYALSFTRNVHFTQNDKRVPALEQVRFAVTTHRGCVGGCAFCAIGAHQGKTVSSRSPASVFAELKRIVAHPEFRGTITDLGGPTANMYETSCAQKSRCERPSCLWPTMCRNLRSDSTAYLNLLQEAAKTLGVKHLFVTTGIRTDLAVKSKALVRELAKHRTSGLMKVAPEHISPPVLMLMRKPPVDSFLEFLEMHRRYSAEAGRKQYVVPYLMAAHPGSRMEDMEKLREFMKTHNLRAEQCQIFTPTPGTAATVMYATGLDPATMKPVFVEKDPRRKQMQKDKILF